LQEDCQWPLAVGHWELNTLQLLAEGNSQPSENLPEGRFETQQGGNFFQHFSRTLSLNFFNRKACERFENVWSGYVSTEFCRPINYTSFTRQSF
jgi:hypothetical protein